MSTLIIRDLPNETSYLHQLDSVAANGIVGGSTQPVRPVHKTCFSSAQNTQSYLGLLERDGGLLVGYIEGSCVYHVCVSD